MKPFLPFGAAGTAPGFVHSHVPSGIHRTSRPASYGALVHTRWLENGYTINVAFSGNRPSSLLNHPSCPHDGAYGMSSCTIFSLCGPADSPGEMSAVSQAEEYPSVWHRQNVWISSIIYYTFYLLLHSYVLKCISVAKHALPTPHGSVLHMCSPVKQTRVYKNIRVPKRKTEELFLLQH